MKCPLCNKGMSFIEIQNFKPVNKYRCETPKCYFHRHPKNKSFVEGFREAQNLSQKP